MTDVYGFCADRGYKPEGEAIRVGSWPVQFILAFNSLTREAMLEAEIVDYDGELLRVVRPDHLTFIALSVGRAKDFARILGSVRVRKREARSDRSTRRQSWPC